MQRTPLRGAADLGRSVKNRAMRKVMIMSKLHLLPCLDSAAMAASRRQELDIPRDVAAALGRSVVEAASQGYYVTEAGRRVDWRDAVEAACAAKVSIAPHVTLPRQEQVALPETRLQVSNETTLGAAFRLVESGLRPLALNFANGVQPGGGFLGGARAQEEVLCRSSALYQTLVDDPMYEAHRERPSPDSTDWAIYSPDVPVFRKDGGTVLEHFWLLSFLTCAAPYAPIIGQPEAGDLLQHRIHRILGILFSAHGAVEPLPMIHIARLPIFGRRWRTISRVRFPISYLLSPIGLRRENSLGRSAMFSVLCDRSRGYPKREIDRTRRCT
jgi:uncharacterized protein (TIGR02452 family)